MLTAPERRITAVVMTETEAGALVNGVGLLKTEVTSISARSSIDKRFRSSTDWGRAALTGAAIMPITAMAQTAAARPGLPHRRPCSAFPFWPAPLSARRTLERKRVA